jgi:hypothetical protein
MVLGSSTSGWYIHAGLLSTDSVMVPVEGPYTSRDYAELRLAHLVPREIAEALLILVEAGMRSGEARPVLRVRPRLRGSG